jgi:anthranilate phosphoribosyltransferase
MSDGTPPHHLEWPLRIVAGADGAVDLATVEQDDRAEIEHGIALALEVRPRQFDWDPQFGTPSATGATDPGEAAALIEAALQDIEPRPASLAVSVVDTDGAREIHLKVKV